MEEITPIQKGTRMNKPSKIIRCGPITAAIWSDSKVVNNTMVEVHNIKIDKSYKDNDEWKRTQSFAAEDLPKIAMVANEAYRHLRVHSSEGDGNPPQPAEASD